MNALLYMFSGALFGAGLALSGMTNPAKVLGFLDVTSGSWDPSLAFVMVGAMGVFSILNQWIHKREKPILEGRLPGPWSNTGMSPRLFIGAAIFGIGWGLSGICPGPALASISTLKIEIALYLTGLIAGMLVAQRLLGADKPALEAPKESLQRPCPQTSEKVEALCQ